MKTDLAELSFINNDIISYEVGLVACDTCVPIRNIGYRVIVDLSEKEWAIIKKLNSDALIELLKNEESDFAANLILYDLYNQDAMLISMNNDKISWRSNMKSDDIAYWVDILNNEE